MPADLDAGTASAPDDIRSALSAAFDASGPPDMAPEPAAPPPETTKPDAAEAPSASQDRPRGPDGKFIAADTAKPDAAEPEAKADAAPKPDATTDEKAATDTKPAGEDDAFAKATAKWTQADKDMARGLPPDAQQFLLRRHQAMEADYTRKMQDQAEFRRNWEPVDRLFTPHRQIMDQRGLTPSNLIEGWIRMEQAVADPRAAPAFIAGAIKQYGIDPQAVIQALGGAPAARAQGDTPPAPDGAASQQPITLPPELQAEIQELKSWKQQEIESRQAQQRRELNSQAARVMSEIETFRDATDTAGNPLHPHFAEVENDMAVLAEVHRRTRGTQPSVEELYNQAVWANPSVRAKLQAEHDAAAEAQRQAAEQKRQQEARAKAVRAQTAAASVTGSPVSGGTQARRPAEEGLRATLEAAFGDQEAA